MNDEPIHIYVPEDSNDPRSGEADPLGVIVHRGPPLHPDDLDVVNGMPVTSLARTLVDMAEESSKEELRGMFQRVRDRGMLELEAVEASAERAEWRPSKPMLYEVIDEFRD